MRSEKIIKKIRIYAILAFILPFLAINACLLFYKFVGNLNINTHANFDYNEQGQSQTYKIKEFDKITNDKKSYTFINCSKYKYFNSWAFLDGQSISSARGDLSYKDFKKNEKKISNYITKGQVKSVTRIYTKIPNDDCVKNYHFLYSLFSKFRFLEKIVLESIENNVTGFSKINNPYLYGEVSISRTARYFPATLIFKPLIILSSIVLLFYWKNNLNIFNELKNKNILSQFSKKFLYIGVLSCIFLILHAILLGSDFEVKWFEKIRRLIIILFIFFEVTAQILLTKNLYECKNELKNYINIAVLKIKITFVVIVSIVTLIAFLILSFADPETNFKHILEWNYFIFLSFYYLLSRFIWSISKNPVHAP